VAIRGPLHHIDLSIRDPDASIPFYSVLFESLGYRRMQIDPPGFQGAAPRRACWNIRYPDGASFGIEVRPARGESRDRPHDRYAPGLHHLAFHAESPEAVDAVHRALCDAGATVLDPPTDYTGQPGYSPGYYAVFFADPDGVKLEVAYVPGTNP
jgi:catechol 2,3-dioxygenase-like lactoylglutathione lyase family enzyme